MTRARSFGMDCRIRSLSVMALLATVLAACGGAPSASSSSVASSEGAWTEQHPAVSPSPRDMAAMAYDPSTGTAVLFGGQSDNPSRTPLGLDDTWTWNGTTWTEQHPATSPPPRWDATLAYNPTTRTLVLFGGQSFDRVFGDTWTWNGTTWTEQHPAMSPSPRIRVAMALDPKTGQDVLFGGIASDNHLRDTWTWDGQSWNQLHPQSSPPYISGAGFAADPAAEQLVMFGGNTNPGLSESAQTWLWNGSDWKHWIGTPHPSAREYPATATAVGGDGIVLFGGLTVIGPLGPHGDTWRWSSAGWRELSLSSGPPGREAAVMVEDAEDGTVVLFGGENTYHGTLFGDTWTFRSS